MSEPISIPPIGPSRIELDPRSLRVSQPAQAPSGKSFSEIFSEAVGEVQRLQNEADTTIKQLVAGDIKDVTDAMIAVEKADVAFQTMMVVRNKVVAAYEEIMRMQV
jgi:flagellar hook-basal body complex protein FliE